MGHAEFLGNRLSTRIEINTDDHVGTGHPSALDDIEPDAAKAENDDIGARLDAGRVDDGADAGRHAATDVTNLIERRVRSDFGKGYFRHHGEISEGRCAHVMMDLLTAEAEAAAAIGHQTLTLRGPDRLAKIGLLAEAVVALAAFGCVERNDVIALFQAGDVGPGIDHHAGAFMAEDRWKKTLGIGAGKRVIIGVAEAGRLYLDQHLAGFRPI